MPAPMFQLLFHTTVLFKHCTVRFKMFSLFFYIFNILFLRRVLKPITVQYYIADCVHLLPRLTLLDFQMHSQNGTHAYEGDLTVILFGAMLCLSDPLGCLSSGPCSMTALCWCPEALLGWSLKLTALLGHSVLWNLGGSSYAHRPVHPSLE